MTTWTANASATTLAPPMSDDATIALHDASKTFGPTLALDRLSLTVPCGQMLALLGPNGAGKTTAIALMLGLRPASGGTVRLMGRATRATQPPAPRSGRCSRRPTCPAC